MILNDVYLKEKIKYKKYIIMIRVGSFYEVYGEEAFIISNIFGYKIKKVGSSFRVGFPICAYNKVIDKLNSLKISYVIFDGDKIKKTFKNNNYDTFFSGGSIKDRIDKIYERLNNLKNDKDIVFILDNIEGLL